MTSHAQLDETLATRAPIFRRIWFLLTVFIFLLALALLPGYLNVNRLQRRIAASISGSLGRPVHFDNVTLNLLPIPSFTIDNFVVSEDPAFGYEPTIRANTVTARLRASTLWRRRIEISRITFTDPSVNIVHLADGRWNLDAILLQAAHISTAPTAQPTAGPAPRFPYIEATGARLNLKLDNRKTPFSLTEADFALWLPSPETWHFRIAARPARTDVPEGYSGLLRVEGTLGRAPSLAQIPLDLHAEWRSAPLGEVSRIVLGHDASWRGEMTLNATVIGTAGSNTLHTTLHLADVHRAAFVPLHLLDFSAECEANITSAFTAIPKLECALPSASTSPIFRLAASFPNLQQPAPTALQADLAPIPASTFVPLLQTFSHRTPPRLTLGGTLSGSFSCDEAPCDPTHIKGTLSFKDVSLLADPEENAPISVANATFETVPRPEKNSSHRPHQVSMMPDQSTSLLLLPTAVPLGSRDPVQLTGQLDDRGFILHLNGIATSDRLVALSKVFPQFSAGFPTPLTPSSSIRLDETLTYTWSGAQSWQQDIQRPTLIAHPAKPHRRH